MKNPRERSRDLVERAIELSRRPRNQTWNDLAPDRCKNDGNGADDRTTSGHSRDDDRESNEN